MLVNGLKSEKEGKETIGPMLIYDVIHNTIKLFNESFENQNTEKIDIVKNIAIGKEKGAIESIDVFIHLKELVLKNMAPVSID